MLYATSEYESQLPHQPHQRLVSPTSQQLHGLDLSQDAERNSKERLASLELPLEPTCSTECKHRSFSARRLITVGRMGDLPCHQMNSAPIPLPSTLLPVCGWSICYFFHESAQPLAVRHYMCRNYCLFHTGTKHLLMPLSLCLLPHSVMVPIEVLRRTLNPPIYSEGNLNLSISHRFIIRSAMLGWVGWYSTYPLLHCALYNHSQCS